MKIGGTFKAALLAASMFGLAACGGSEPIDPGMFDAEVQRLVDEGDMYGEIFLVLKERRPRVYGGFRNIAVREFSRGRPAREASFVAGMQMREVFIDEILKLSRGASDENVKEMISVIIATYEHLNSEDPADCARTIDGLPPEKVKEYPPELRKREMQLVMDLLNSPKEMANRRVASEQEVVNWMINMSSLEPTVLEMLPILENTEDRGGEQNEKICNGMITVYKRLSYKSAESRGTLFRGMALMAMKQKQLQKNAAEEEAAAS